jgi:ribose/xylose/arabinose/galactoside ABC-type transport system permease subunit
MAYLYSEGSYIRTNFRSSGILKLNDARIAAVPLPVILMAIVYVLGYLVLHRTKHGRRFYAIGSNAVAARFSGVAVERYVMAAFVACAVLASFANMIQIAAQGNGNVKGGLSLLMPAYATVFVGVSLFKKPTALGTFLGALLIAVVQNGLSGKKFYYMELVVGVVLMAAIVISVVDFQQLGLRLRRRKGSPGRGAAP